MSFFEFEVVRELYDYPTLSKPNTKNTCTPHFHKQMEFLYVTKGQNIVTINGVTQTLLENQLAIADSYDIHSFDSHLGDISISFIIPHSLIEEYNHIKANNILSSNFVLEQAKALEFKKLLDLLDTYWNSENTLLIESLMKSFLGLIVEYVGFKQENKKYNQPLIRGIFEFIEKHYMDNDCLDAVASNFGYSKYYFSSLFKRLIKINFNDYLNMQRVSKAIQIINSKNLSVLEASSTVGFNSLATFYRCVKNLFNTSPLKLKNHDIYDNLRVLSELNSDYDNILYNATNK